MSKPISFPERYSMYRHVSAIQAKPSANQDYDKFVEEYVSDILSEQESFEGIRDHLAGNSREKLDVDALPEDMIPTMLDMAVTAEAESSWVLRESDSADSVDPGLYEGVEDHDRALVIKAHFALEADVRDRINEVLEEMHDAYDERLSDLEDEQRKIEELLDNGVELNEEQKLSKVLTANDEIMEVVAAVTGYNEGMRNLGHDPEPAPIIPGSGEEASLLASYLLQSRTVGLAGDGPMGSSYVDARASAGEAVYNFIELDKLASGALSVYPLDYDGTDYVQDVADLDDLYSVLYEAKEHVESEDVEFLDAEIKKINERIRQLKGLSVHDRYKDCGAAFPDMVRSLEKAETISKSAFKEMLVKRDLSGMYRSDLEKYLSLVHPEVYASYKVQSHGVLSMNIIDLLNGEEKDGLTFESILGRTEFGHLEAVNELKDEIERARNVEPDNDLEP